MTRATDRSDLLPNKLLLVDDDELHLRLAVDELKKSNWEAKTAVNAEGALTLICSGFRFAAIITDSCIFQHGDEQGFKVWEEAVKLSPVIVASGDLTIAQRVKAESLGITKIFAKPFPLPDLRHELDKFRNGAIESKDLESENTDTELVAFQGLPDSLLHGGAIELAIVEGVTIFRASVAVQTQIEELIAKQKAIGLSDMEEKELDRYEALDDFLSLQNRLTRNHLMTKQGGIGVL